MSSLFPDPKQIILFLFVTSVLSGCGDDEIVKPDPPPTVINAAIRTSDKVNPDLDGRPSPLVVRTYELKALGTFESADFYNLFDNHESLLGADLVASEKFHLQPGEHKKLVRTLPAETKFFAVTAAYRDLNQAVWKDVLSIPQSKTTEIIILVDELAVSIWRK